MKYFLIVLVILFSVSILQAQEFYFVSEKNTVVYNYQNLELVKKFQEEGSMYYNATAYNGMKLIFLPVMYNIKAKKKYVVSGNYLAQYEYNNTFDVAEFIDVKCTGYEIDLTKTGKNRIKEKKDNKDTKNDPHEPKDLKDKVKDKEKNNPSISPGNKIKDNGRINGGN